MTKPDKQKGVVDERRSRNGGAQISQLFAAHEGTAFRTLPATKLEKAGGA